MAIRAIFALPTLLFLFAAAVATPAGADPAAAADGGSGEPATCVPTLQRMLSCLDFIEHGTDAIPRACCVQVRTTVAEQPCCLMHVVRGDVAKLVGPDFDAVRAMVNVTAKCLGDASVMVSLARSCAGKPLPPLTPEYPFTDAALSTPSSSGATRLQGSSYIALFLALLASVVGGVAGMQQI